MRSPAVPTTSRMPAAERRAMVLDAARGVFGSRGYQVLPGRYQVSVRDIRLEYGHLADEQWRLGRRAALTGFQATPAIFVTPQGRQLWEQAARANVADELAHLDLGQLL